MRLDTLYEVTSIGRDEVNCVAGILACDNSQPVTSPGGALFPIVLVPDNFLETPVL